MGRNVVIKKKHKNSTAEEQNKNRNRKWRRRSCKEKVEELVRKDNRKPREKFNALTAHHVNISRLVFCQRKRKVGRVLCVVSRDTE